MPDRPIEQSNSSFSHSFALGDTNGASRSSVSAEHFKTDAKDGQLLALTKPST